MSSSSRQSPAEESLTNGVDQEDGSAATSGMASLGVSGDGPCGEKHVEEATGEEGGEAAATAAGYTVTITASSVTPTQVDPEAKWSTESDKYCQTMGITHEGSAGEVSFQISL